MYARFFPRELDFGRLQAEMALAPEDHALLLLR
jgi:hypothetical protein